VGLQDVRGYDTPDGSVAVCGHAAGPPGIHRTDGTPLAMYSMAGFAEYAVVPVTALAPVPDGLDVVSAAVLGCAGLTAYGAVYNAARLEPGESSEALGRKIHITAPTAFIGQMV
jgi:NADPH:quinone reductase-like Zn-dependent oxidoreductase